jgi:hypothetical protein
MRIPTFFSISSNCLTSRQATRRPRREPNIREGIDKFYAGVKNNAVDVPEAGEAGLPVLERSVIDSSEKSDP